MRTRLIVAAVLAGLALVWLASATLYTVSEGSRRWSFGSRADRRPRQAGPEGQGAADRQRVHLRHAASLLLPRPSR